MHLEDEQVERLLHSELDPKAEEAAFRHFETCADCRARVGEAERDEKRIFELLRRVDHAAPSVDAEIVADRAHDRMKIDAGNRANYYPADRTRDRAAASRSRVVARVRWATGILLALAAVGVAYATPGSPLPAWASRVAWWIESRAARPARVVQPTPAEPGSAGIAVAPSERFVIHFATTQAEGAVAVSLTDGPEITARALNGTATFTSDIDRLTIENGGSTADFQIDVPHDARWVEIRVGLRRLLLKRGDSIITDTKPDTRGRYILPLTQPGQ